MIQRNSAQAASNSGRLPSESDALSQLDLAIDRIKIILSDGLKHGYFSCRISAEVGKHKHRELIIEAGKSYKFTIPFDELSN